MRSFADLPAQIAALARGRERLGVVLLDAFGWSFVERHAGHPFLQRLEIEPLDSQFPSTTTAHLTTLYTGLPVEEHGLYEWRVYEPLAADVIRPLPFLPARDGDPPLTLAPRDVFPGPSVFERSEVPCTVLQPAAIAGTQYASAAFAGATVVPFETIEEGARLLGTFPGLTYLYWDRIDAVGHKHGPSSANQNETTEYTINDGTDARLGPTTRLPDGRIAFGGLANGRVYLFDPANESLVYVDGIGTLKDGMTARGESEIWVSEMGTVLDRIDWNGAVAADAGTDSASADAAVDAGSDGGPVADAGQD